MSEPRLIATVTDLLWPALRAVRSVGDSGTIEEIDEAVARLEAYTEEHLNAPHGNGRQTKIEYRLAWARTYLKGMGLLDNSERAVWSTTELGRSTGEAEIVSATVTGKSGDGGIDGIGVYRLSLVLPRGGGVKRGARTCQIRCPAA